MKHKNNMLFNHNNIEKSIVCGIDEAGRGPIAGPLVVVGVVLKKDINNLDDSKKIGEKKREALYKQLIKNSKYHIYMASSLKIDTKGLSFCIKEALLEIKEVFGKEVKYIFDGNSSYNVENIQTLIKADSKIKEVSAASIIAKVFRDNLMKEFATIYPQYGFDKNKGYGTKAHIEAIKKYGYCNIHRKSFNIKLDKCSTTLF